MPSPTVRSVSCFVWEGLRAATDTSCVLAPPVSGIGPWIAGATGPGRPGRAGLRPYLGGGYAGGVPLPCIALRSGGDCSPMRVVQFRGQLHGHRQFPGCLWFANSTGDVAIGDCRTLARKADTVFVFDLARPATAQIVELVALSTAHIGGTSRAAGAAPHSICQDF